MAIHGRMELRDLRSFNTDESPPAFLLSIAVETDEDERSLMAVSFNVTCDEIATAAITARTLSPSGAATSGLGSNWEMLALSKFVPLLPH